LETIELKGKKISILGLASSGKALARVLAKKGAVLLVSDVKPKEQLVDIQKDLADLHLEWETGGHTDRIYKNRDMVIISPGISIYTPILQEAKNAGVPVISEVEMAFLLTESPFIAVTGTNGKSTTTTLVHKTILAAGRKSRLAGNIGIPMVGEVEDVPPDTWITSEISSFQLEAVEHFHPKVAVLTNITTDHIDRHGSFEEYKQAKGNLFNRQGAEDYAVLNAADPAVMSLLPRIKAHKLFFNRFKRVGEGAFFEDGYVRTIFKGEEKTWFSWEKIPLRGVHNLENVLAVTCVCLALDISAEALMQALMEFEPLHHRMEYVDTIAGIKFFNDSKGTNPDAVRASMESFDEPVVLIAGGTDKGLDFLPLAENIKKHAVHAVLIGESRSKIADALEKAGFNEYTIIDDMTLQGFKSAIKTAWKKCPSGGVVLLSPSCASFDMFHRAEHRGDMFNIFVGELKIEYGVQKEKI
jgi:UDP-N-acetylmuramoylalanine--D-glutamate ligase